MGERRTRDKEKTTQDILSAARRLFSRNGLHGTSIRDIEVASGVSKGLILHHFGTKENLYAAVQDELAGEYTSALAARRLEVDDFRHLVAATIRESFQYTKEHPHYQRIGLWAHLEGQERNTGLEKRFTTSLVAAMRLGQQNGLVREDIDPFVMPFIIKGAIDHWIMKENLIRDLAAAGEPAGSGADERLIEALSVLFLK